MLMGMNAKKALALAAAAARVGQLSFTGHALDEMDEANATERDVERACMTATRALSQPDNRWRLEGGCDCAGEGLTVCVAITHGVVVVTVF